MASESIAHSVFGLMDYWLRAHSGSCSEDKSPMVSNPDPKQNWNNWKNDMSPGRGGGTRYILGWGGAARPSYPDLFKTKIADFPTLFRTEFRLLIPCLRHLTRNHTLCKTIVNIETLSYLIHWQSQNYLPLDQQSHEERFIVQEKIPCLRQKSRKTYPGWPHVHIKPLWGSTPPPGPGDMSLISATNQERRYEQLLHNCSRVTFLICCCIISFDHQKDHVNRLNMGFLSVPKAYFTTRISPNIDRFKVYFEQKWKDREEFSNFLIKIMDSLLCKKIQKWGLFKNDIFFYNNCANLRTLIGRELWSMREKTMEMTWHVTHCGLFCFGFS